MTWKDWRNKFLELGEDIMKYNDGIIKTKVKTGKREKKGYPLIRWLLIGSLLIQSGFTVLPQDVETLDLVTHAELAADLPQPGASLASPAVG